MCLHRKIFHQLQIEKNVINLAMGIVAIATTTIGIGINPTNTLENTTRQFWQQFEISSANHTNWQHSKRTNIIKLIQSAAITTTTVRNHAFECEKIFWNRIASMHTKKPHQPILAANYTNNRLSKHNFKCDAEASTYLLAQNGFGLDLFPTKATKKTSKRNETRRYKSIIKLSTNKPVNQPIK